mmetsp:Transcript_225/g.465  ORF Transcript_225/g.465 Transcript_225/m.465 type:complete len:213 (+) Transcript_225:319-957(+)
MVASGVCARTSAATRMATHAHVPFFTSRDISPDSPKIASASSWIFWFLSFRNWKLSSTIASFGMSNLASSAVSLFATSFLIAAKVSASACSDGSGIPPMGRPPSMEKDGELVPSSSSSPLASSAFLFRFASSGASAAWRGAGARSSGAGPAENARRNAVALEPEMPAGVLAKHAGEECANASSAAAAAAPTTRSVTVRPLRITMLREEPVKR